METIILVVHLIIALALVCVVLLQRSEGGALGIGGGGGGGGFMTGRGAADILTRTTSILAFCFFATSIGLSLIAAHGSSPGSILDQTPLEVPADNMENAEGSESGSAPLVPAPMGSSIGKDAEAIEDAGRLPGEGEALKPELTEEPVANQPSGPAEPAVPRAE